MILGVNEAFRSSLPIVYSPCKWVVLQRWLVSISVVLLVPNGAFPQIMSTYLNANIDEEMKEMNFEHSSESDNSKKACCQQIQRITEHHAWLTTKCNEGKWALLACPRFTEMRDACLLICWFFHFFLEGTVHTHVWHIFDILCPRWDADLCISFLMQPEIWIWQ